MIKAVNLKDLTSGREIAAGGEGKIYEYDNNQVVKVYHKSRNKDFTDHLLRLQSLSDKFVKPIVIFQDSRSQTLGFSMNYVNFNNYWLFNNLFNKGFCTANSIDRQFKIKVLQSLAKEIEELHKKGIVIGDLNQYNLFFNKKAEILFVDVDSYQTTYNSHSGILLDDIRDWCTSAINSSTDMWAYDILAFWSTTYCHPFKWIIPGNKQSLEERVKLGKSILTTMQGVKIPALYEPPTAQEQEQYQEIFVAQRRYMINFSGSYAKAPLIVKQHTQSQTLDIRKLYDNVTEVNSSGNYVAIKRNGKWLLVESSYPKVTRIIEELSCDVMYPAGNGEYVYVKNEYLCVPGSSIKRKFLDPVYDYNHGSLTVIDNMRDVQWNFDISSQLGGNVSGNNTTVFAKSIIKRTGLLQNFGSAKFINVGKLNSSTLIPVPEGTIDGYVDHQYVIVEVKKKNKVEYQIINHQTKDVLNIDHFSKLSVSGDVILVPNDGYIDVYHKSLSGGKFDCSVCTKNSQLFKTGSGILLLEDNTLYLLNTKN